MTGQVTLSFLQSGKYALRGSCTEQERCRSSWEIDIDQTLLTLGDTTLAELRQQMRCPRCNSPITTTLISLK
jgi:hypothetical protein